MITQVLPCPHGQGIDLVRHGKTPQGKQRYRCRETSRHGGTFLLDYFYPGQSPHIKEQIVAMAMNASGIRDTARVLHVSPTTVIKELKKGTRAPLKPEQIEVEICRADELAVPRGLSSEVDEMWRYVGKKAKPRWLWQAIDHRTGKVLAYVFGRRQDKVFLRLQALLEPCGITRYYTDGWGTYERHVDAEQHIVGKEHMQRIESKPTNLRTRIKRVSAPHDLLFEDGAYARSGHRTVCQPL